MEFSALTTTGSPPTKRAFHSCSIIEGAFYIFGGISDDKTVLNDLYRFDLSAMSWSQIDVVPLSSPYKPMVSHSFPKGRLCMAPAVSHHTATVIRDRYIIIIGGWNGRKRSAEVYCFDTVDPTWRHIHESGDVPVGLSSHTTLLASQKTVVIIGREGGVHMQRRFSGAFMLDFESGKYSEAPFHAASRSGHTANLIRLQGSKKHYLFVFGGRKSGGYEFLGEWSKVNYSHCSVGRDWIDKVLSHCGGRVPEPCGRQHPQTVELSPRYLVIFGGETWTGVRENVTNEIYILDSQHMNWYKVPVSEQIPKLVGHTMCIVDSKLLVFGGKIRNKCTNVLWEIKSAG